jgi:hypothetical protein
MSRKVYLEAEGTLLVPVKAKFSLIVRADEGAAIDRNLERWAKGEKIASTLDIGEISDVKVVAVGDNALGNEDSDAYDAEEALNMAVEAILEAPVKINSLKLANVEVIDSR